MELGSSFNCIVGNVQYLTPFHLLIISPAIWSCGKSIVVQIMRTADGSCPLPFAVCPVLSIHDHLRRPGVDTVGCRARFHA